MMSTIVLLTVAIAMSYTALRYRRRRAAPDPKERDTGFHPGIGFTLLDGGEALSLLLDNTSETPVWTEEVEIFLTNLVADAQTAEPTFNRIQKIRQTVAPGDLLPISLSEAIYRAAGEPQRKHSSILSSVVRFRIGQENFEKTLETYRIQMNGLTASRVSRERRSVLAFPAQEKPQRVPAMAARIK